MNRDATSGAQIARQEMRQINVVERRPRDAPALRPGPRVPGLLAAQNASAGNAITASAPAEMRASWAPVSGSMRWA